MVSPVPVGAAPKGLYISADDLINFKSLLIIDLDLMAALTQN